MQPVQCSVCSEEKCEKQQCKDRIKSSQEVLESVDDLIKQLYP